MSPNEPQRRPSLDIPTTVVSKLAQGVEVMMRAPKIPIFLIRVSHSYYQIPTKREILQNYKDSLFSKQKPNEPERRPELAEKTKEKNGIIRAGKSISEREQGELDNQIDSSKRSLNFEIKNKFRQNPSAAPNPAPEPKKSELEALAVTNQPERLGSDPGMKEMGLGERPDEDRECKICFNHLANTVLLPCLHGGMCIKCAKEVHGTSNSKCSFCNQVRGM